MTVKEQIEEALQAAFSPDRLVVIDESESHRGHSGWREGGETHFRVEVVSEKFAGLGRLECHRLVHRALTPSPIDGIHALSISASPK